MIEARELFNSLSKEDLELHIELGNNAKYAVMPIMPSVQFQLESRGSFDSQEVLYVPGLKKNILSILVMEDNGYEVKFQRGQVFICSGGDNPNTALRIGVRDGNLYRLKGQLVQALMHIIESLCELWNKRMGHLHHKSLPLLRQMVIGIPDFSLDHRGVCRGCALGIVGGPMSRGVKASFPSSETQSKYILDPIHSDIGGPM
jgi:hypothetical protein